MLFIKRHLLLAIKINRQTHLKRNFLLAAMERNPFKELQELGDAQSVVNTLHTARST